jgi:hypothetical protein
VNVFSRSNACETSICGHACLRQGRPGTTNAFAQLLQVFAMQLDQIAERFRVAGASCDGGFAAIDAPLDVKRRFLGVLSAQECLIDIFSFPPHLGTPGPGIELGERRQNVCAPCALSRRTAG